MKRNLFCIIMMVVFLAQALSAWAEPAELESEVTFAQGRLFLRDLATNGRVSVAVGDYGTVVVSEDRVHWQESNLPIGVMADFVYWNGEEFVVVVDASHFEAASLFVSPNGRNWRYVDLSDPESAEKYGGVLTEEYCYLDGPDQTVYRVQLEPGYSREPITMYKINGRYMEFFRWDQNQEVARLNVSERPGGEDLSSEFHNPRLMTYDDGLYRVYDLYRKSKEYVTGGDAAVLEILTSRDLVTWETVSSYEFQTNQSDYCSVAVRGGSIYVYYPGTLNDTEQPGDKADYAYYYEYGEMVSEDGQTFRQTGRKFPHVDNNVFNPCKPVLLDDGGILIQNYHHIYYAPSDGEAFQQVYTQDTHADPSYTYFSEYYPEWTGQEWRTPLPGETRKFEPNVENRHYKWMGNGYICYYITSEQFLKSDHTTEAILVGESLDIADLVATTQVPGYVHDMEAVNGVYYAKSIHYRGQENMIYYSTDFETWNLLEGCTELPVALSPASSNYLFPVTEMIRSVQGYTVLNQTQINFVQNNRGTGVVYEAMTPKKVGSTHTYYYAASETGEHYDKQTTLWLSDDGVYWSGVKLPRNAANVSYAYEYKDKLAVRCVQDEIFEYTIFFDKEQIYQLAADKMPENKVYVKANNKILGFETPPVTEDDRTLVPMRFLFEQLGAEVKWDGSTQTATAVRNDTTITFSLNDTMAEINSEPVVMEVPARLIGDKTMVPLRFLSENLGYDVQWDDSTNMAIIESVA